VYVNRPGLVTECDSAARSQRTPADVRVLAASAQVTVPGTRLVCLSGAWRLVGDPFCPLGDRGEITGLDQFVRLKNA
jgi:hypothetical protein